MSVIRGGSPSLQFAPFVRTLFAMQRQQQGLGEGAPSQASPVQAVKMVRDLVGSLRNPAHAARWRNLAWRHDALWADVPVPIGVGLAYRTTVAGPSHNPDYTAAVADAVLAGGLMVQGIESSTIGVADASIAAAECALVQSNSRNAPIVQVIAALNALDPEDSVQQITALIQTVNAARSGTVQEAFIERVLTVVARYPEKPGDPKISAAQLADLLGALQGVQWCDRALKACSPALRWRLADLLLPGLFNDDVAARQPVVLRLHAVINVLSGEQRLQLFLELARAVPIHGDNMKDVHGLLARIFRKIPLRVHRQWLRAHAAEQADSSQWRLYRFFFHGQPGGQYAMRNWSPPSSWDYQIHEPEADVATEDRQAQVMFLRANQTMGQWYPVEVGGLRMTVTQRLALQNGRQTVLGIVHTPQGDWARLFYRSQSGGEWRVSAWMADGKYHKGKHYVVTNQVLPELAAAWEALGTALIEAEEDIPIWSDGHAQFVESLFDERNLSSAFVDAIRQDFESASTVLAPEALAESRRLRSGEALQRVSPWERILGKIVHESVRKPATMPQLAGLKFPDGFFPDFSKGPDVEQPEYHPGLGTYGVAKIYHQGEIDGVPLTWTFRVFAGRIAVAVSPRASGITVFGTSAVYLDAGVVQSKLLEYRDQLSAMPAHAHPPVDTDYDDQSPILRVLPPVREFIRSGQALDGDPVGLAALVESWADNPQQITLGGQPLLLAHQGEAGPDVAVKTGKAESAVTVTYSLDKDGCTRCTIRHTIGQPYYTVTVIRQAGAASKMRHVYRDILPASADGLRLALERLRFVVQR